MVVYKVVVGREVVGDGDVVLALCVLMNKVW